MYHIDRKKDKPDVGRMEVIVQGLMNRGLRLADCEGLRDYYVNLRDELKEDFASKYGVENPNSSKQLTAYIENLADSISLSSNNDIINNCYDSEKNKWTTSAEAMEKLADLGYEFAQDILDYRHAKKYAESILSIMNAADSNGLIHPRVSLGKTHRINYSDPGVMSIPKKLLWHVIAPYTDGNVLYSIDIKNQEPSLLINMTGADELKYALESDDGLYETMFKQCFMPTTKANVLIDTLPENRVYSMAELKALGTISPASYSPIKPSINNLYYNGKRVIAIETVCGGSVKGVKIELPSTVDIELEDGSIESVEVEWESADKKYKRGNDYELEGKLKGLDIQISKVERKEFKQSWLALSYGATAFGVKNMCKNIDGSKVYKYVTGIKAIKDYRSAIDKLARNGVVNINTIFGTGLYSDVDPSDVKKLNRVLLDLPIQGSAADILSLLINRFYDYTKENELADKMNLYYTRHDELIVEVNGGWLKEVGEEKVESILRDMLEHQIDDWVPFKIEVTQTRAEELGVNLEDE